MAIVSASSIWTVLGLGCLYFVWGFRTGEGVSEESWLFSINNSNGAEWMGLDNPHSLLSVFLYDRQRERKRKPVEDSALQSLQLNVENWHRGIKSVHSAKKWKQA